MTSFTGLYRRHWKKTWGMETILLYPAFLLKPEDGPSSGSSRKGFWQESVLQKIYFGRQIHRYNLQVLRGMVNPWLPGNGHLNWRPPCIRSCSAKGLC